MLMGSTQKMGAGTNVQDRLIALHDVDCPWRPADVGRILRAICLLCHKTHLSANAKRCSDHVGIVEKVENGTVYTIEGNSGDTCKQHNYTIGYGTP